MVKRRIVKDYYNHYYIQKYGLLKNICNNYIKKLGRQFDINYFDDFMAIAKVELLYSMIHFNSSLGAFNTFLYHRVSGSVSHFIDSSIKQATRYETELRKEFINAEYNEPTCSGLIIEEMLESLDKEEAEILRLRYLSNMTLLEITEKTGFSTYKILSLQNEATEKLQNKFGGDSYYER